ncbi:glycosyltransferase [Cryobacterium sp. 1639]|uniref:glycosyltransferase n=1 Tax=Cryobacterium inferilacus TaxID=2866629 RepID=UPI001C7315E2|nr:glycosyltransferase [Cryobacterium sp. 1639]MBX0301334.1 glycosyltransferase [Cryobacterium sp. 1639]
MAQTPRLAVVIPGGQPNTSDGRVKIARKTVTGMVAYQERWPGEVVMVGRDAGEDGNVGLGGEWVRAEDLPFRLHVAGDLGEALASARPDIVLAPHHPDFRAVFDASVPAALTSEIPARDAAIPPLEERPAPVARARIVAGAVRYEGQLRRMAKRAAGLQCNGWSAWEAYSRFSPDPLLFYDTRLTRAQVDEASLDDRELLPDGRLRIAFSGRFVTGKGPIYAVRLHDELRARGVAHTMTLVGGGPLESVLRVAADGDVQFLAPMDFDTEWVRWARESVDVMVLPHIQGDPSGTYLESGGLGVPVLGFDNTALRNLVSRFDLGWAVPLRNVQALADIVQRLVADRGLLADRGERGRRFMQEHHFDAEFDRRIEHLVRILASR